MRTNRASLRPLTLFHSTLSFILSLPGLAMKVHPTLSLAFAALASAHSFPFKRIKHESHALHRRSPQTPSSGQITTSNPGTDFSLRCAAAQLSLGLPAH